METFLSILISAVVVFGLGPHIDSSILRTVVRWGFGVIGILCLTEFVRKWIFPIASLGVAVFVSPYVDSPLWQAVARWGLGGIGAIMLFDALRPILAEKRRDWARNADWKAKTKALNKVKELAGKRDVKGLSRFLRHRKIASVRREAAEALGEIGDASAVAPLTAALQDSDMNVRINSVGALAKMGPAAVSPLVAALRDKNDSVRREAAAGLGKTGDARAVAPLTAALKDSDNTVRRNSAAALAKMGSAAVPALVTALADKDNSVRQAAAKALGGISDARATAPLAAALQNKNNSEAIQQAIVEALDRLGWQPDMSEVGATYWVTKRQWEQCVNIGGPAVRPLSPLLTDSRKGYRQAAADALVRIYGSGRLGHAEMLLITNQRDKITQKHEDGDRHYDDTTYRSSDCDSHSDYDQHVDTGIGVNFPA